MSPAVQRLFKITEVAGEKAVLHVSHEATVLIMYEDLKILPSVIPSVAEIDIVRMSDD